ncbi:hypothetical protein Pelo_5766 [Pelomyxa schiedti]|nr:hypothetical protein Pelo_5766 [Pelomyxa schiedti]
MMEVVPGRAADTFPTPSATAIQLETEKQRILGISRVVWEQVVVPWVLRPALARRKWDRTLRPAAASCVLATAEAMFPLVALASRALLASLSWGTRLCASPHYRTIQDAAAALSPRCVAWIIASRTKTHNGGGEGGVAQIWGVGRKKAREQVAVLRGLCMGGHLVMAQREGGDVDLGKWFIEEKGVTLKPWDVNEACSGTHGNVAFVEWLVKEMGGSVSSDRLLECLHMALSNQSQNSVALWLEELLIASTGRRPKISLSTLVKWQNDAYPNWLEWVLNHTLFCDIDCSQDEVVKAVGCIVGEKVCALPNSLKSNLAIS